MTRPPIDALRDLATISGLLALGVLVFVEVALVVALWRYNSSRPGAPSTLAGDRRVEVVWTAVPVLILAVLIVAMTGTVREIGAFSAAPAGTAYEIDVRAGQFWWEYRYPDGTVTANELRIPVATPILLRVESRDVIHSYWIPPLGPKVDAVPGKTNLLRLYADEPGTYDGACAEFCGLEHAWMRVRAIAMPREEFDRWLAAEGRPAARDAAGEKVFHEQLCGVCHTVRGTEAAGTAGPDLTHVASRTTLGAGVLANDAAALRRWLSDTQGVKPGALMPTVPLTPGELDALVAYLGSLR